MTDTVPLTPRSRRRQISRHNRESEGGERQRRVPVSDSPVSGLSWTLLIAK